VCLLVSDQDKTHTAYNSRERMTTGGVMVKIEVKTEVEVDTHQLNIEVRTSSVLDPLPTNENS